MSVSIDSEPLAADTLGLKTVGQVISHVQRSRRLVVNVLLDGQEPDLSNLQALRAAPLLGHTLFIETADPKLMASSVLNDMTTGLLESERLCDSVIEHLNNQTPAKAIEQLAGCLSIWQHVQESIEKIGQLLKLDTARIEVRGLRFDQLLADFTAQLRTIKSSLENRDYVLLNDTLTYEIAVARPDWHAAIDALRQAVERA